MLPSSARVCCRRKKCLARRNSNSKDKIIINKIDLLSSTDVFEKCTKTLMMSATILDSRLGGAQGIAKFGNADLVACPSLHINSTN